jgi:phosphopantetheinyl transferase
MAQIRIANLTGEDILPFSSGHKDAYSDLGRRVYPGGQIMILSLHPETIAKNSGQYVEIIGLNASTSERCDLFTPREQMRFNTMGSRRRVSFAGARVAIKLLYRRLTGDSDTPDSRLETVAADLVRPCMPHAQMHPYRFCAASHDDRFAVAVAGKVPVGVDVENVSDRILRIQKYFLSDQEMDLVERAVMTRREAATRIWTIKESVAKAMNFSLPEALARVRVSALGKNRSDIQIDEKKAQALSSLFQGHVVSLLHLQQMP